MDPVIARRVAVIAVHGVADQRPGDTTEAISHLLANLESADGPAYTAFTAAALQIPVRPLRVPAADERDGIGRTFAQRAPHIRQQAQDRRRETDAAGVAPATPDVGLQFMATLLAGYEAGGPDETYGTEVLSATRKGTATERPIDVDLHELYWADLSRPSQRAWRIAGELYQLMFHLGSLGVHVVTAAQAAESQVGGNRAWAMWAWAQLRASQCLAVVIPLIHLAFAGLGFVLLSHVAPAQAVAPLAVGVAGLAIAGVATLRLARAERRHAAANAAAESMAMWLTPLALALAAMAATIAVWAWPELMTETAARRLLMFEAAALAAGLIGLVANVYSERRPSATRIGLTAGVLLGGVLTWRLMAADATPGALDTAVLRMVELLYVALGLSWLVFFALSWMAFAGGALIGRAARDNDRIRRATWTARLTLALPAAALVVFTTMMWAAARVAARPLLERIEYVPSPALAWLVHDTSGRPGSADAFVEALVANGGALGFAPLLVLLALAVVLLAYAVGPVVLAEVFPPRPVSDGGSLGLWLDRGFRLMRQAGRLVCVGVLVVLPLGLVLLWSAPPDWARPTRTILAWAAGVLVPASAGLLLFGGRLRSLALGFREALDVLLDVDSYLREHPLDRPPRARMAARFASLLRHVYAQPYDAVVVIAHSQGTVIAADLFRFITAMPAEARDPELERRAGRPLLFFTMGSPLRQLYGLRFPHLYRWARHEVTDAWTAPGPRIHRQAVPDPAKLGVQLWVNAYRSGDYVGRYLWRPDVCDFAYHAVPAEGTQPWRIAPLARVESVTDAPIDRREFCIGTGAHTHYWDATAPEIALQLDELIQSGGRAS